MSKQEYKTLGLIYFIINYLDITPSSRDRIGNQLEKIIMKLENTMDKEVSHELGKKTWARFLKLKSKDKKGVFIK